MLLQKFLYVNADISSTLSFNYKVTDVEKLAHLIL